MNFEQEIQKWLLEALDSAIPENVVAFSFNLFEQGLNSEAKFGIELIGAEEFDPNDEDWACEEIWSPKHRSLSIPLAFSGGTWEECFVKMKAVLSQIVQADSRLSRVLKSSEGIGVGFVDGNLEVIWQR